MTSEREAEIEPCFSCDVEFHFSKGIEQFENLLEDFKIRSNTAKVNDDDDTQSSDEENIVNSGFGDKARRDRLIVMDNVSGLAHESKKLASFLAVARKFSYTCVIHFSHYLPRKINLENNSFTNKYF